MARFKHYDYNQQTMVVINYLEQLQPGTFEFALHYLISEKLDLSAFTSLIKMIPKVAQLTIQPFC